MNSSKLAYLFVFLTIIIWGSSATIGKLLLGSLDFFQVEFYSGVFSTISLFIIAMTQKKAHIMQSYSFRDHLFFAFMGLVGFFLYGVAFLFALSKLPAQEAYIVNYLWPIMTVLWAVILLGEKLTVRKFFALLLSFIAIILVVSKGQIDTLKFQSFPGVLSALFGAVCYGLFSVLGKKYPYEQFSSMTMMSGYSVIYITVATLIFSHIPTVNFPQLLGLLWGGVFISGIATVCWFLALKHGDTSIISNASFLTPFLSLVFIRLFVGEKIEPASFVGLAVLVCAIALQSVERPEKS
ncbi:MAG: DMT family transporter [Candidatus Pacebacteria bacterium]|nr:DMT family transporter [Candidatus Paceibacterota bacterium]